MSDNTELTARSREQKKPAPSKLRMFAGKIALAGLALFFPLEYAASDAGAGRLYGALTSEVHPFKNPPVNNLLVDGLELGAIAAESTLAGMAFSKSKKFKNVSNDYEEYIEERQKEMSKPRHALSTVLNLPRIGITKLAEASEKKGEAIEAGAKSSITRNMGRFVTETSMVNIIGTTGAIGLETARNNPPSVGKMLRYSAEIGVPVVGAAQAIKELDHVAGVRDVLGPIGRGVVELTSANFSTLTSGDIALASLATVMAVSGWRLAQYRQNRSELAAEAELTAPSPVVIQNSVPPDQTI